MKSKAKAKAYVVPYNKRWLAQNRAAELFEQGGLKVYCYKNNGGLILSATPDESLIQIVNETIRKELDLPLFNFCANFKY